MKILYTAFGWCLAQFYGITGSYGWSIVLFSVFAQLIMLPISIKQSKAMEIQKAISPQTQKIQEKYPHDKEKQNDEIMKLYKANNYNPISGCLPVLIQFPIIIGLFGALRQPDVYVFTPEKYAMIAQNFLWIKDMSITPMTLFKTTGFSIESALAMILPVVCVALTFVQQKLTDASVDKTQQTMMYFMTAMVGYFSLTISQGVAIYWTLRTALGIIQQKIISKKPVDIEIPEKTPSRRKN